MLGNCSCFCGRLLSFFSKLTFSKFLSGTLHVYRSVKQFGSRSESTFNWGWRQKLQLPRFKFQTKCLDSDQIGPKEAVWPVSTFCNSGFESITTKQANWLITLCIRETPKRVLLHTVKTQMKCSIMMHFIGVYTVCKVKKFFRQKKYIFWKL